MSDNNAPKIEHDVFVNFRGTDIRNTFLSHLIDYFKRNRINYYVDYKLETGEEIGPSLMLAIERSSISLIIFSQDYASSHWCLEELVKILECREKYGQIVIPVFYNVEPTEVRHQSCESYRNAFAEHDGKYKNEVQIWRDALNNSSEMSGIVSSTFQNDAEVVEEIGKKVMERLPQRPVKSKGLVGIDEKIATIESWIREASDDTLLIGIWGMGGIGKTTLAKEVFNKLQPEYDGSYFLCNERENSKKHGICPLKKELHSNLLGNDTPNYVRQDIGRRIGCMKVLVGLDDVSDSGHIEQLLGARDNFGPGSRVIVTTRDEQVLKANRADHTYRLTELSDGEALELFKLNVCNQSNHERKYGELSRRVVGHARGIPLVVKVLAGHLCEKNKEVWESMLDKLKKNPPEKVYEILKLSYDGLDRKEQKIFLDLACFFLMTHDKVNVGYLKFLLKENESDNSVAYGLESLKDKALITFSEDNYVCMHDILQEMAWDVVRHEDPRSRSRLWDPDDIDEALKNIKDIQAIRSLRLHWPTTEKEKISLDIVVKMTRLQFLEISGYDFVDTNPRPKWPASIMDILAKKFQISATELKYLCWYQYPLESLPNKFFAEKLVILKLPVGRIKKLWDGVKNLVNLKELDLSQSKMLEGVPDLSKATNLEVLNLRGCSKLTSVHPSIFSLPKLEKLDLAGCVPLTILKSNSHLCSLSYLNLDRCENLREFSVISVNMKELRLGWTNVKELPSSFKIQSKLNFLHLTSTDIEGLPLPFKNHTQLLILDVSYCQKLKLIPTLPESLKTLDANHCWSLTNLSNLPRSLRTLDVSYCDSLPNIPKLPHLLETLDVKYCKKLRTLPELPRGLETLNAKWCLSVQTIPELPRFLTTLDACHCKALQTVLLTSNRVDQLKEKRKRVLFWNCLKLDKRSLRAIALNAKINVMNFANNHLSTPDHYQARNYEDYDYGNNHRSYQALYVYPGNSVPCWLENKTTENYITFNLSSIPTPLGFIFCFVLGEYRRAKTIERFEVNITIGDGEGACESDIVKMYIDDFKERTIESDHVCVMYDQRCSAFLLSRVKNQTRITVKVTLEALIISHLGSTRHELLEWQVFKGFGIRPISSSTYSMFIQQMELDDSLYQLHYAS